MRADQYVKIGAPKLNNRVVKFRGIDSDSNNNNTLGEFATEIVADNTSYLMRIHVVSDILMQHALIVGTDFLNTVELNMKEGNISICKMSDDKIPNTLRINEIMLRNDTPVCQSQRRLAPMQKKGMNEHIKEFGNVIEHQSGNMERNALNRNPSVCIVVSVYEPRALRPRKVQREDINLIKSVHSENSETQDGHPR
ncbi:hypothetical protein K0M31_001840 [Melipona bicolor]|uniref:Uncharacterized protein n=1 Tax=Melipona bicolor TaxID=60889 RepID=A0AA40KY89_9HYME|nr:hypothetical protein K0M31_001840 [Melipona bicolor]